MAEVGHSISTVRIIGVCFMPCAMGQYNIQLPFSASLAYLYGLAYVFDRFYFFVRETFALCSSSLHLIDRIACIFEWKLRLQCRAIEYI